MEKKELSLTCGNVSASTLTMDMTTTMKMMRQVWRCAAHGGREGQSEGHGESYVGILEL